MKRLMMISSILFLGACSTESDTVDTIDVPSVSDEGVPSVSDEDVTSVSDEGAGPTETAIGDTPRRLHSVDTDGDVSYALHQEAAGKEPSLMLQIKNNTLTPIDVSSDAVVLNRNGEYVGEAVYDPVEIAPGLETTLDMDVSSLAFDKQDDGLFYTLEIPIDDSVIHLDFYIGDALDLIAATPGWYGDEHEGMSEDDQALIDWITRHE